MNKTYSAKSSAIRAASKALNVARNLKAVLAVADVYPVEGGWAWEMMSPPDVPAPKPVIPIPEPIPEVAP